MNRINIVGLGVRDMKTSLAFYKSIGFETFEKSDDPPVVFFNNHGSKLELFPLEALAKDINEASPPALSTGGFSGFTLACNMESEQQVDEFIARVESNGGRVAKQPQKVFWGGYSGYFQDPDGYYWEVAYGPQWKFGDDGMLILEP